MSETDPSEKKRFTKPATDPDKCAEMAKKYGWDYQRFIPNNDPVLKVDCEFVGEEIYFQELWYDHQD
ncbi:hypothetical protein QUA43_01985 [Microcoleus sp. N9_B4]|uniref:hypothetical protein n=1 Tax=Microcoleus sp. N9_B4 TaxID=3055386 RepID=UPI002FD41C6E